MSGEHIGDDLLEPDGSTIVQAESMYDLPESSPLELQDILEYVVLPPTLVPDAAHAPKTIGTLSFEVIVPLQPGEEKRDTVYPLETGGIGGGPVAHEVAFLQHQY